MFKFLLYFNLFWCWFSKGLAMAIVAFSHFYKIPLEYSFYTTFFGCTTQHSFFLFFLCYETFFCRLVFLLVFFFHNLMQSNWNELLMHQRILLVQKVHSIFFVKIFDDIKRKLKISQNGQISGFGIFNFSNSNCFVIFGFPSKKFLFLKANILLSYHKKFEADSINREENIL